MSLLTWFAIYFIIWWLVLFTVLPFRLRTQQEVGEVTLGTSGSAPAGGHLKRAFVITTLATALICIVFYGLVEFFDFEFSDIPSLIPARPEQQ